MCVRRSISRCRLVLRGTIRSRNMAVVVVYTITGGGNTTGEAERCRSRRWWSNSNKRDRRRKGASVDHVITPTIIKRRNAFCFNIESNLDRRPSGRRRLIAAITRPRFAMPKREESLAVCKLLRRGLRLSAQLRTLRARLSIPQKLPIYGAWEKSLRSFYFSVYTLPVI